MEATLEIYKQGTKARFKVGGQEAIITAAGIRGQRINYELSYMVNGEHKSEWVEECEFETEEKEKQTIGYKA